MKLLRDLTHRWSSMITPRLRHEFRWKVCMLDRMTTLSFLHVKKREETYLLVNRRTVWRRRSQRRAKGPITSVSARSSTHQQNRITSPLDWATSGKFISMSPSRFFVSGELTSIIFNE